MEDGRKIVLFPVDRFYAVVGTITLLDVTEGPYSMTLADICNHKSSSTHSAREHMHRSGRLYLSAAEFYSLRGHRPKVCDTMNAVHLPLNSIQGIIDFHPERFQGNPLKRQEQLERGLEMGRISFLLHEHVLSGVACEMDIYRLSDQVIGLSQLRVDELPETEYLSLPGFLETIGCPQPDYMAVNLAAVFHS